MTATISVGASSHVSAGLGPRAHAQITTMSVTHTVDEFGFIHINGYQVSRALKTPTWEDVEAINFVSDRRTDLAALDGQGHGNGQRWVLAGANRPHPTILFDHTQMQYLMFMAKVAFNNKWRIISARAMELPTACEYEVMFLNDPHDAIYGPSVILTEGITSRYALYVTTQNSGDTPRLAVSFSTDGEAWGPLQNVVDGTAAPIEAAYPSVIRDGTRLVMAAETPGSVAIYESIDGTEWSLVSTPSLSGTPARPGLIKLNNNFVLYYHDGTNIRSTYSADLVTWSGDQLEIAGATNPHPYLDWHLGNQELFLLYTVLDGSDHVVHRARLEDRVWQAGASNKIYAATANLISVPVTPTGTTRSCAIDMAAHGVGANDNVKVRLLFTDWSPQEHEYHRQSAWVGLNNSTDTESYLDPLPWRFVEELANYPYLQ